MFHLSLQLLFKTFLAQIYTYQAMLNTCTETAEHSRVNCFLLSDLVKTGMHPRTVHSKLPNVIFDEQLFISSWVVTYRQTDAEKLNGIFFATTCCELTLKEKCIYSNTKMLISSTWATHTKMGYNSLLLVTQCCIKRPAIHTKIHTTKNICKYYFHGRFFIQILQDTTLNDDVPGDVLTLLGENGLKLMTQWINIYETGEWSTEDTMIAVKKNPKATKCSNHRTYSKDNSEDILEERLK